MLTKRCVFSEVEEKYTKSAIGHDLCCKLIPPASDPAIMRQLTQLSDAYLVVGVALRAT